MHALHRRSRTRSAVLSAACLALLGGVAACGSNSSSPAASSGTSAGSVSPAGGASSSPAGGAPAASGGASTTQVHLAMELLFSGVPFSAETQAGAEAAAKELNVKLDVGAPPTLDPPTAISQVANYLNTGVAGIAIGDEPAPLWTRALDDAVTKTKGNTVTFNTAPARGTSVKTFVGVDAAALGEQIATATIKAAGLGPQTTGEVIISRCVPQSAPLTLTVGGMAKAAKQLLPKATVLAPFNSMVVPSQNFAAWEQEARAHPNAVLALGSCDQDGDSMIKAKSDTGAKFVIGATDTSPQVLKGIADGTVAADVAQNWYVEGYTVIRLLAEAARNGGTPPAGWINPGTTVITKANVAALQARDASAAGQAAFYQPIIASLWADLSAATKPLSLVQGG